MRDSRDKNRRIARRALERMDKARHFRDQQEMEEAPDRSKTRKAIILEARNNPGSFDFNPGLHPAY